MANQETYRFEVDPRVEKAISRLQEVERMMTNIDRLSNNVNRAHNKGADDYNTTNQKDMDKSMRSMAQLTKMYREANRELAELYHTMREAGDNLFTPQGASNEQQKEIDRLKRTYDDYAKAVVGRQREMARGYDETLKKHRELARFQQNSSRNFKPLSESRDRRNLSSETFGDGTNVDFTKARRELDGLIENADEATSSIQNIVDQIREVNKLDRRSESLSRRASASNYMSHQQASNFRDDYHTSQSNYVMQAEQNRQAMTQLQVQRTAMFNQIKDIENRPDATQEQIDQKIQLQHNIEALDKEWDKRMELNRTLERTTKNMEEYNKRLIEGRDGAGTEVKPERGTMRGMMYERAPAIGLAMMATSGAVAGGMYARGQSVNANIRDDVISIGQRTRQDDWRVNVRDNAINAGLADNLGFTSQEMLNFQNNYLSNRGFQDLDDLNTAMQSQAEFSRVTGLNAETTAGFFDTLFDSAKLTGSSVSDIQTAFVGAIKQSGMEGREEDQLNALNTIVAEVGRGRTLGQEEVMNIMGMQSLLANTGVESLRGGTGAQFMADLSQGIRSGIDDPNTRLLFGMGSQYQGIEGRWELAKRLEAGADVENLSYLGRVASTFSPGNEIKQNQIFLSILRDSLGVDASTEQVEGLMDAYRNGELTQDNIDSILDRDMSVGSSESTERLGDYQGSREALANQSEATSEAQATQLNDLGDVVRRVNSSMGGMPPVVYMAIASIAALGAAATGTVASFAVARGARVLTTGSRYGRERAGGTRSERHNGGGGGGFWGIPWGGGDRNRGQHTPKHSAPSRVGGFTSGLGSLLTMGGLLGGIMSTGGIAGRNPNTESERNNTRTGNRTSGGRFGAIGNFFSSGANGARELLSRGQNTRVGGWMSKGWEGTKSLAGKGGNLLSRGGNALGNIASKAFLPLALLSGAGQVMSAPEGERSRAVGETAGGLGGALGGGTLGATLGTALFPGIGTAIGGILGSIAGGVGGSKLGGWVGDKVGGIGSWFSGLFGRNKEEEAKIASDHSGSSKGENGIKEQLDRENATRKDQVETKRGDNILDERTNLSRQEQLMNKADGLLRQARLQNGIYGTPMGAGGGMSESAGILSGNSNAEKIWNFFSEKGFSSASIAGIMGNLKQESGLDPTAVNASSGAFGIAQWLGGRKTNLHNFARQNGGDVNSLETQLDFLWHELQGAEKNSFNRFGGLDSFMKSTDPRQASDIFEKAFERSGGSAMEKRRNNAQDYYNQYGSLRVDSNINVNVTGDETVSSQVRNSSELNRTAQVIQERIFGSTNFHAREMRRV